MECNGSYGSKIETLVQHLLYIQVTEPEAKSIVFSAWADSLHSEHQIGHLCEEIQGLTCPTQSFNMP